MQFSRLHTGMRERLLDTAVSALTVFSICNKQPVWFLAKAKTKVHVREKVKMAATWYSRRRRHNSRTMVSISFQQKLIDFLLNGD